MTGSRRTKTCMNDIYDRAERSASSCIIESMRKVAPRPWHILPNEIHDIYKVHCCVCEWMGGRVDNWLLVSSMLLRGDRNLLTNSQVRPSRYDIDIVQDSCPTASHNAMHCFALQACMSFLRPPLQYTYLHNCSTLSHITSHLSSVQFILFHPILSPRLASPHHLIS